jgi:hypothetical protein
VRRRQQTDPDGPQLVPLYGRLPVPPLRTVGARQVDRRWLPCHDRDRRASLRVTVDAKGRTVRWCGNPFNPGSPDAWQLTVGLPMLSSGAVMDWLEQERKRRRRGARTAGDDGGG